ncbi:MAG: purR [Clostridia bacterium]|jgi:purine operon repressor|nr:purR [Clostridia bacterium]
MEKFKKNERVVALIKILTDNPNEVVTLNRFSELLNAAKSTISEDISAARRIIEYLSLGELETIPGALGGVIYKPILTQEQSMAFLVRLCEKLRDPSRIIPGNFIYMSDILGDAAQVSTIGKIFASRFKDRRADYIVTIETKGITPAIMTARAMNLPMVIARNDNKVTEGSTISVNYVSGSKRIQTMSISKRSIKEGSKVLIIDDFMKGGSTVKGLKELMAEFKAEVVGIGVIMSTAEPEHKVIDDYVSLLRLNGVDDINRTIDIIPDIKL